MVPHIREAYRCPVFLKFCVTRVSSTAEEVLGVILEEGMHTLISPLCIPSRTIHVGYESLLKKCFRKHHYCDVRYVAKQVALQMLQT